MRTLKRAVLVCVLGALTAGMSGCTLTTLTLTDTRATGWTLADPTAIDSGGQYTYGTQFFVFRVPTISPNGQISEAFSAKPAWASGEYTAGPDVRKFPNGKTLLYFTATPNGSSANTNNCIGVAVAESMTRFVPQPNALLCGEVWDPNVEFLSDGTPVLLYSQHEGGRQYIRSIRLTSDGLGTQGVGTRRDLLSAGPGAAETIENATAFWDGTGNQWVMLFSQGDWKTSEYRTVMAYCLGPNLDATCNIQGPRGSFPFNPKGFGIYGSGGMDVFRRADGQLQAVWHFWGSNDPWTRGDRKTAQSGISVTYPTN